MESLRAAFVRLDLAPPWSYRKLQAPRPKSLGDLMIASKPPRFDEATRHRTWFAENLPYSEEAQGIDADVSDNAMFIVGNARDARKGLYRRTIGELTTSFFPFPESMRNDVHLGSLAVRDGWIYVPLKGEANVAPEEAFYGVWKVKTDFSQSLILSCATKSELFSWCDINPHNKLLYTSLIIGDPGVEPPILFAFDASAVSDGPLVARPEHNISFVQGNPESRGLQGARFTPYFRVLTVNDHEQEKSIHCHSTLTGVLQGLLKCPGGELESVSLVDLVAEDGTVTQIQVLDLDNDSPSGDDVDLWGFHVPDAQNL